MTEMLQNNKARGLFDIDPNTTGPGFTLHLSNGDVDVPDQGGVYVISTGCGSGKTESIKSLISRKCNEGIMYCVNSIQELEKMYWWIRYNLCSNQGPMREDDVICISSSQSNRTDLSNYRHNPSLLTRKKIVLLTHVRFWTDLINYFVVYDPKGLNQEPVFDGDFTKLMARDDLRRYIIFDETPTFIKPFVTFERMVLGIMGEETKEGWKCLSRDKMEDRYNQFLKGTGNKFFKGDFELDRIKKEVVLNAFPRYYSQWMDSDGECSITFKPADLFKPNVKSHVMIYEGAGDLLFTPSPYYTVLDVKQKYSSKVEFTKIPLKKRRYVDYSDQDKQEIAAQLSDIVRGNQGKTLIVLWQTVGKKALDEDKEDKSSPFVDEIKRLMTVNPTAYSIIYFGSSDTKSTNEFRDYQNIIIYGWWGVSNYETFKFNYCFGSNITNTEHRSWVYVQLLTRIGIRDHSQRGRYKVFYTDDYSEAFIRGLSEYFNNNRNILKASLRDKIDEILDNSHIDKRVIPHIKKLAAADPDLKDAIEMGTQKSFDFTLKWVYSVVPIRKRAQMDSYRGIIKALGKLGICLNIAP